jgi:GTP-binding protein
LINFQRTTFVKTVVDVASRPSLVLPEIILIGRSNAGKSSFINAITKQKNLAKVSQTPGKTRYLNYFNVDDQCYFVDAPGYGYTARGRSEVAQFATLMETYFKEVQPRLAIFLQDSRRPFVNDDLKFIQTLLKSTPVFIAFTKVDQLNQSATAKLHQYMASLPFASDMMMTWSIRKPIFSETFQSMISSKLAM